MHLKGSNTFIRSILWLLVTKEDGQFVYGIHVHSISSLDIFWYGYRQKKERIFEKVVNSYFPWGC